MKFPLLFPSKKKANIPMNLVNLNTRKCCRFHCDSSAYSQFSDLKIEFQI